MWVPNLSAIQTGYEMPRYNIFMFHCVWSHWASVLLSALKTDNRTYRLEADSVVTINLHFKKKSAYALKTPRVVTRQSYSSVASLHLHR